jgi:hypothetical protein
MPTVADACRKSASPSRSGAVLVLLRDIAVRVRGAGSLAHLLGESVS